MNFVASHIPNAIRAHSNDFIVIVAFFLGALATLAICTRYGRRLLSSGVRTIIGPKLRFAAYERGIVWFGTVAEQRYIVSLNGIWKVSNRSRRDVTLKSFYIDGLATEHHMLMPISGPRDGGALIPAGKAIDVETFCLVQKTLTWRSGTFVAGICFVEDGGKAHKIKKVKFNHIKQSTSLIGEKVLSSDSREVA